MSEEIVVKTTAVRETDDSSELTADRIFKLLKNSRRRMIVDHLSREGGETTRSRLAEMIAAEENEVPLSELASDQRKRVYVSLYQTHLPALARDDVIHYDADRGTVVPGPNMEELTHHLQFTPESHETTGTSYYIGLSLVGGLMYALIRMTGEWTPGTVDLWAVGFVTAILLTSVALMWG